MEELTKYQIEMLNLYKDGLTKNQIAEKLWVEEDSVKRCFYRIRKKFNVKTMDEVIEITKGVKG